MTDITEADARTVFEDIGMSRAAIASAMEAEGVDSHAALLGAMNASPERFEALKADQEALDEIRRTQQETEFARGTAWRLAAGTVACLSAGPLATLSGMGLGQTAKAVLFFAGCSLAVWLVIHVFNAGRRGAL